MREHEDWDWRMSAAFEVGVVTKLAEMAGTVVSAPKPLDPAEAPTRTSAARPKARGPSSAEKASWAAHRDSVMADVKNKPRVMDSVSPKAPVKTRPKPVAKPKPKLSPKLKAKPAAIRRAARAGAKSGGGWKGRAALALGAGALGAGAGILATRKNQG